MRIVLFPLSVLAMQLAAQPLVINFNTHYETCNNSNGSVQAWVSGGVQPYTLLWSNSQTTDSISGLAAGTYTLTVTDDLGTMLAEDAVVQNVNDVGASGGGTHAGAAFTTGFGVPCEGLCNGAMAMPQGLYYGVPPYSFSWSDPSITQIGISVQGDPIYYGFCGGQNYNYQVLDANGCSSNTFTGAITQMDSTSFARVDSVDAADCLLDNGIVYLSIPNWCAQFDVYQNGALLFSTGDNIFTAELEDLGPGVYDIGVRYCVSGCDQWLSVTVPATGPNCGQVDGTVFNDANLNCVQDAGDVGIPYRIMRVNPVNELVISSSDGRFAESLPPGSYTLEQLDPGLFPICPLPQPVPFTLIGDTATIDLADTTDWGNSVDLGISAGSWFARPGFLHTVFATVQNNSVNASGPATITCVLDMQTSYFQATPAPTAVIGNTVQWVLPSVGPFAQADFGVFTLVDVLAPIGDPILHLWTVSTAPPDVNSSNDQAGTLTGVTGSFDPNDKTAFTSSGLSSTEYYVNQDEYIDYVIRFQNTGNDTAFTVVVVDTLAGELDMSSFEQRTASHPFTVAFKPGRVVEWRFENILLADSNTNEPLSHGLVSFRIKPVLPLVPGVLLENAADIFFDFNSPVRTNTSTLIASSGVSTTSLPTATGLRIFPNPANDRLHIAADGFDLRSIRILAADGRVTGHYNASGAHMQADISALHAGAYLLEVMAADGTVHHRRIIVR